jgi:hypothetical protein
MPWQRGQSGNPKGRPKGLRHRCVVALEAIGFDAGEEIIRTVVRLAKAGDLDACRILLDRLWPRGRFPIEFKLPTLSKASDLTAAIAALTKEMAEGRLTPQEAAHVGVVFDLHRKAHEATELEQRIERLERAVNQTRRQRLNGTEDHDRPSQPAH